MILTFVVMILLVSALVLLAFFLGSQHAVQRLTTSTPTTTTSETPATTTKDRAPSVTIPDTPRASWVGLDMWVRGTVFVAAPLEFSKEVTLALNDANIPRGAVADKNEVYLYFVDVVYDSRCPEETDCYAAGDAIVEMQLQAFGKPTKTFYLGTNTGGKPDRWTYHGMQDMSFMTPEVEAEIARGQKQISETTYVEGETYNTGGAIVDGYHISLRKLSPTRHHDGSSTPVIPKENFQATLVVTPAE